MRTSTLIFLGIVAALGIPALIALFIWLQPPSFAVDSEPLRAEVWLDGQRLGTTPLSVKLPDHATHLLELRPANAEFIPVEYQVDGRQPLADLRVRLFPGQPPADVLEEQLAAGQVTPDWQWAIRPEHNGNESEQIIYQPADPNQLFRMSASPLVDEQSRRALTLDRLSLSADGRQIAFAYAFQPAATGCGGAPSRAWLAPVARLSQRQPIMLNAGGEPDLCLSDFRFSPDARWLAALAAAPGVTDTTRLSLIATDRPRQPYQALPQAVDGLPFWSPDSQRLAVAGRDPDSEAPLARLWQLAGETWAPAGAALPGQPLGWTADSQAIWILDCAQSNRCALQAIAADDRRLRQAVVLNTRKTSARWLAEGEWNAFVVWGEATAAGAAPGELILYHSGTTQQARLDDAGDDYRQPLYWLDGGRRLVVLVDRVTQTDRQTRLRIVDMPRP